VNSSLRMALLAAALAAPAAHGRLSGLGGPSAPQPVLRVVADVPLPGPPVRFGHLSFDVGRDRLYIAHMGAGRIVVFDLKNRRVVTTIAGMPGVTGVRAVPSLRRLYASVTRLHQVSVMDEGSLQLLARLGHIGFPNGIAYAPDQRKIYVADEGGGGLLVIDARADTVLHTVDIDGEAAQTLFDPGSRCILVAMPARNELYVIDPATERILGRFELPGSARPHGLAIDVARRRAFVASEGNARLLTVDLRTMRVIDTEQIGDAPDALAFDPLWRRLYVASETGVVSAFTETSTGLAHDGDIALPHAHVVGVDPRTHLVYLPLQDVGGRPVLRIMASDPPGGR
jgi:DNA-binding beta-propeller fold protein YncE